MPRENHRHRPQVCKAVLLLVFVLAGIGIGGCASRRGAGDATAVDRAEVQDWTTIGYSVYRQPILATTFGHGERRVYVIGLIHGDEQEGLALVPDLLDRLGRPEQAGSATVRFVLNMNPDGAEAHSRGNARGVDLNRNWPASNFSPSRTRGDRPLSEPETLAVYADLLTFKPELVIVLHSTIRHGPFVNYDGPAAVVADQFVAAAAQLDPAWHARADMGYPTPGSLGTYIGVDRRIPILTIEFARGVDGDEAAVAGLLAAIQSGPAEHDLAE